LQDFDDEVRPAVDVEQFLDQDCVLLLGEDVPTQTYSSSADLVDLLLGRMRLSPTVVEEAKTILFTNNDSGVSKLRKYLVSYIHMLLLCYVLQYQL
jgi:hypothetical protein